MNSHSLKFLLRSLWNNKTFSIINILGLTLGITCCILVWVIARYELSFDAYHDKAERTYRVTQHVKTIERERHLGTTPYPLAEALRKDVSGLEAVTATHYFHDEAFAVNREQFEEKGILFAEPEFFSIFDHSWLHGSPEASLAEPNTVVLTQTLAQKYFPDGSAIGQTIRIADQADLKVSGILLDPPNNTNLPFSMVISFATFQRLEKSKAEDWQHTYAGTTFLTLEENTAPDRVESQLEALKSGYLGQEEARQRTFSLQALSDIHTNVLYGHGLNYAAPTQVIWALGMLGFLILVIVCINFINLATAHTLKRSKEVAIRKVLGSSRAQLVWGFLAETATLTTIALGLSLVLSWLLLPLFNQYLSIISLNLQLDLSVLFFSVAIIVVVTLLAGLFPALIVSNFKLLDILKNKISGEKKGSIGMRKVLIITQFVFCQVFLLGTIIIHKQMVFLKEKELGFAREGILIVDLPDKQDAAAQASRNSMALLQEKLLSSPYFKRASYFSSTPNRARYHTALTMQGVPEQHEAQINYIDPQYLETFAVKLVAGQNLPAITNTEATQHLLVNESFVRKMGYTASDEILGKQISLSDGPTGEVVGVVQDYHNNSLRENIEPMVLLHGPGEFLQLGINFANTTGAGEIGAGNSAMLQQLEKSWREVYPRELISYKYFDEVMATEYVLEDILYQASKIFSFVAIFIGCLGLYGLVSYMTIRRTKEIAVRKVLGASAAGIFFLLSKEFMLLIVIAFAISVPIGLFVMGQWLQNYAYGVSLDVLSFLGAFVATIAVAYLTVSYETIKAALLNPAKSLKAD